MIYLNNIAKARIAAQERFACENCGNCCTQCSNITVTRQDITRLAEYFKKSEKVVFKRHCKLYKDMIVFKNDRPCKFYDLKNKRCKIYEARPQACRDHPFLSAEPIWFESFITPNHCGGAIKVYEEMKKNGEIK